MNRTLAALAIVAGALAGGAPAFADGQADSAVVAFPGLGKLTAPDPGRQESTTCGGEIGCAILGAACGLVSGTYSEWDSRDHGHPHGICTWPWE